MSRTNKSGAPDGVYSDFYEPFIGRQRNNPVRNRQRLLENMYIRVLTELACNRFRWVGLPDTVDVRFLELTLFRNALSVFYFDKDYDRYLALRASGVGRLNMYDNPTSFNVIGNNMLQKRLGPKQCVPIWANYLRVPDLDIVTIYAGKLARADRTIEITLDNMRTPKIVYTNEDQRLSFQNMIRQVEEGMPVVYAQVDQMNPIEDATQVLDFGIDPNTIDKLMVARTRLWNECMGLLGINNANQDKKERLVADEVSANDEQVMAMRNVALNARRMGCEQINHMFDMAVQVDFNNEIDPTPLSFGIETDYAELTGNE